MAEREKAEPKLLCDEMLMRLGRWLCAAGYDTAIAASGSSDRALFEEARLEGWLLVSRDRKLAEYRDADTPCAGADGRLP